MFRRKARRGHPPPRHLSIHALPSSLRCWMFRCSAAKRAEAAISTTSPPRHLPPPWPPWAPWSDLSSRGCCCRPRTIHSWASFHMASVTSCPASANGRKRSLVRIPLIERCEVRNKAAHRLDVDVSIAPAVDEAQGLRRDLRQTRLRIDRCDQFTQAGAIGSLPRFLLRSRAGSSSRPTRSPRRRQCWPPHGRAAPARRAPWLCCLPSTCRSRRPATYRRRTDWRAHPG